MWMLLKDEKKLSSGDRPPIIFQLYTAGTKKRFSK